MSSDSGASLRSRTAQGLGWIDPERRALVPPIHTSTNYERAADGSYPGGGSYTRDENPTYGQAEALLAELEGGTEALLYASGMAAATAVTEGLGPGARVVAPERMYWGFRRWLLGQAQAGSLDVEFVPNGDEAALEAALARRPTQLVWLETPANPTLELTDLAACARLAHDRGALVAADSTLATPVHTQPLAHGVDIVMHSATKQLNGHGDVLAGALVTKDESPVWEAIRSQRASRGGVLGPFEAWLLLRGMRTLFLRVEAASVGALTVARWLETHESVVAVNYPGLDSCPDHELALRQMKGGFGCLVSFRVDGGEERARRLAASTKLFVQATSLGGTESLIEHRASVEGPTTTAPWDLLRLSIGIESPDDLIVDLDRALAASV